MDRLDIIQQIIDRIKAKSYLEIGVKKGNVFLKLRVSKKIGVDPKFKIKRKRKLKAILKNLSNISNEYYEMTSDMFFQKYAYRLEDLQGVDVAFIDGLHTYEQSLKDVINCLKFLKEDGIIVIHDCSPLSDAQAYPADSRENAENSCQSDWIGDWSGDVWKTIVFLRSTQKDLNIFVLDCDHGLGIITRGKSESTLEFSKADIDQLSYKDLERNRLKILNLKTTDYLQEFLKKRKSSAI
jgi:hypothetical protein